MMSWTKTSRLTESTTVPGICCPVPYWRSSRRIHLFYSATMQYNLSNVGTALASMFGVLVPRSSSATQSNVLVYTLYSVQANVAAHGNTLQMISLRCYGRLRWPSVGWASAYLCSGMRIRSRACRCLLKGSAALVFKFHRLLFSRGTAVMLDSHGMHLPSW